MSHERAVLGGAAVEPPGLDAYEMVYQRLVERLARTDIAAHAGALGLTLDRADAAVVPLLSRRYRVHAGGVTAIDGRDSPVEDRIVLAHLLLRGGRGVPAGEFVPYRDLAGGMSFASFLARNVEGRLARRFTGRPADLTAAAEALGGRPFDPGAGSDAACELPVLPGLPMRFTFFDADEDFSATARIFYDTKAADLLDLECLAVLAQVLVRELVRAGCPSRPRRDRDLAV